MLYIVSRRVSEIETIQENQENNRRLFDYLGERARLYDIRLKGILVAEKSLHKARRLLLKTDNFLMGVIGKIKNGKKPEEAMTKTDSFWQDIANREAPETKVNVAEVRPMDIKPAFTMDMPLGASETRTEIHSKKRNKKTNLPG